jgi:hypothetical protein
VPSSSSERTLARRTALTTGTQEEKRRWLQPDTAGLAALKADPRRRTGRAPSSPQLVGPSRKVSLALIVLLAGGIAAFDSRQIILSVFIGIVIPSLVSRQKAGGLGRLLVPVTQGVQTSDSSHKLVKSNHPAEPSHLGRLFALSAGILTSTAHPLGLRTGGNPAHFRRPKWR